MRIDSSNRDALARIAERDFGGASLDETVARLAFEHESLAALARLSDDELRDYQEEQRALADTDVDIAE
ncbi:hypothetical protein DFQ14_103183 [Halopolyspora algeriensis]|uniref:Uncharacterized protein n=1 Tax=Halopolyspora algeriensis TaxID=1500506 RepID=A0A368VYA4_9ACTN|nr:hypothetical protein [Halopolyspora algeriensis]RCW45217.1 hypothetical protein DFQ14_103183 [Halopolyspora algeriensis]TQM53064.1 hypothetical protein FHU43_2440 [Halopolyspora algeriensis]